MQRPGFTYPSRSSRPLRLAALGIALAAVAGCAGRAKIEGMVVAPTSVARQPGGSAGLDSAVVYLTDRQDPAPAGKMSHMEVRQTPDGFEPRTLMATENTEVEFLNRDRIYHNVFSVSPAKQFDLGRYGPGEKRSVRFDRAGIVQVFCELHERCWGVIVVLPDRYYARPKSDGSFLITGLAAGEYSVTVWHPSYGSKSRKVSVPKKGRVEVLLQY